MYIQRSNLALKIGHAPLIDSAPLLVAQSEGYFDEFGVEVLLQEEVGWATVREKLIHWELNMASTLIGLPYAMHNGMGCYKTEMNVPLIISANGNTITLTSDVDPILLSSPAKVAEVLKKRAEGAKRKWVFATVNPYSSHLILLSEWLNTYFKDYISEIEIVFLPPPLFPELLEQGMIDGYCAGEPWGSSAEKLGIGNTVANSLSLNANHPEKVLAVPTRTIRKYPKQVEAVGRAVLKACERCSEESYLPKLINILENYEPLGLSATEIEDILKSRYKFGGEEATLHKFAGSGINQPSPAKEQWVIKGLKEAGLFRKKPISVGQIMDSSLLFS